MGGTVSNTIRDGFVNTPLFTPTPKLLALLMFTALTAAATWMLIGSRGQGGVIGCFFLFRLGFCFVFLIYYPCLAFACLWFVCFRSLFAFNDVCEWDPAAPNPKFRTFLVGLGAICSNLLLASGLNHALAGGRPGGLGVLPQGRRGPALRSPVRHRRLVYGWRAVAGRTLSGSHF